MTELEQATKKTYKQFKTAIVNSDFKQWELADMLRTTPAQISRAIHGVDDKRSRELREGLMKILQMN
ncbi:transcriptional regulator [Weissella viridescens]|uniref:transcriptional regulator n=1 Tax=Weissella viridescens TaxID=1629 RepID=UPI001D06EBB3|nr:transcriptional regulator [Weissella viridescens]MCB6839907.1 transcriptional regulator [Weissella viridescens]MCB6846639.1 transcriptional regulator [Weissella viridescens]